MGYQRWNPSPSGVLSPAFDTNTDLAREYSTDHFILSSESVVYKALVNSMNFHPKTFFILQSATFLSHSALFAFLLSWLCEWLIFLASAQASAYIPGICLPYSFALAWMVANSYN
jgi:hypothetical protein